MGGLTGKQIQGIIRTHRDKGSNDRREWDRYRSWYLSEHWNGQEDIPTGGGDVTNEDEINLETNYPYAYIDTMIANVCPTNPQVTISARREELRPVARYREALANEAFRLNKTHTKMWKLATNTSLCGRGIVKLIWNFKRNRPDIRVVDPRFFFFDQSVDWDDIRYCIEVTVLTKGQFKKRLKKKGRKGGAYSGKVAEKAKFDSYPGWLRDQNRDKSLVHTASQEVYKWVTVYEFYDFENEEYSHWIDGVEDPLFRGDMPYKMLGNPFRKLVFNDNMVDEGGIPDVKLVASAYERLNEIDTLELWHAHASTPVTLVNGQLVDNIADLMEGLRNADRAGAMLQVDGKHKAPMRDLIGSTPTPQFNPSFDKMRDRCIHIIEFVLGIPAYARGTVGIADVATEVALADTATRTRNGRRIKAIQDVISWMAEGIINLYEEFLPVDTDLPIRLTDSQEVLTVSRETLEARDPSKVGEGSFDYDYEAVPYSPTENHRLLQLNKIQQYMELLMSHPQIDQDKFLTKLLDLLGLVEIKSTDQPVQPGAMEGIPIPGGEQPSPDSLLSGGLPPGIEPPGQPSIAGGPGAGFAGAAAGLKAGIEGLV